ncbi:MAG: ABC transporter permease, partial [Bacillota bacterium]
MAGSSSSPAPVTRLRGSEDTQARPSRTSRRAPGGWSAGIAILAVCVAAALGAPWIAPFDPTQMHGASRLAPPGWPFLLGTDFYGRDILSRVLWGIRSSLAIAAGSVAGSAAAGTALGVAAGFVGGRLDTLIMRSMDVLFAFPVMLLGIAIVVVLGPGFVSTVVAISVVYIPIFARIARGPTLSARAQPFVEAARALGQTEWVIMWRHVLPNIMGPVLVQVTNSLATAILFESALSFLGLGVQPPAPSLGQMVSEGRGYLELSPWATVFPGAAIMVAVMGFNLMGDALQQR